MYTTCGPDIGNAHTGEEHLSHGYSSANKASQPVESSSRTSVASKEGLPGVIWSGPFREGRTVQGESMRASQFFGNVTVRLVGSFLLATLCLTPSAAVGQTNGSRKNGRDLW